MYLILSMIQLFAVLEQYLSLRLPNFSSPYCKANAAIDHISTDSCSSCEGRCGEVTTMTTGKLCSCDQACRIYRDCCHDFTVECPNIFNQSLILEAQFSSPQTKCLNFIQDNEGHQTLTSLSMVVDCGASHKECAYNFSQGVDFQNGHPVYDSSSSVFFVNEDCAFCNGVRKESLFYQPMTLSCYQENNLFATLETNTPFHTYHHNATTVETPTTTIPDNLPLVTLLHDVLSIPGCSITYKFSLPRRSCRDTIDYCPSSCRNEALIRRCEGVEQSYNQQSLDPTTTYKNLYCTLCHVAVLSPSCYLMYLPEFDYFGAYSLTLMFDINPINGLTVGSVTIHCGNDQGILPDGIHCGDVLCPVGFSLLNGTCQSRQEALYLMRNITYHVVVNHTLPCEMQPDAANIIQQEIFTDFSRICASNFSIELHYECNQTSMFTVVILYDPLVCTNSSFDMEISGSYILMTVIKRWYEPLGLISMSVSYTNFTNAWARWETVEACAGITVPLTAFEVTNNSLLHIATGKTYVQEEYRFDNGSIVLCSQMEDNESGVVRFISSGAFGIVTIAFSSLSLIGIMGRIIVQFTWKKFANPPGRMQCQLVVALGIGLSFVLFAPLASNVDGLCAALGAARYWAFLVLFLWMSIIACDTTWSLYLTNRCVQINVNRPVYQFTLVAWLIPSIITVIVYMLDSDILAIPLKYEPGFGGFACWFTSRNALMLYFYIPVGISICINMISFTISTIFLRKLFSQRSTVRHSSATKQEYKASLKIFTLIGATWFIGLIATWVNNDVIWVLFVILNSSQGVFIFLVFVLDTKRTYKCFQNKGSGIDAIREMLPHVTVNESTENSCGNEQPTFTLEVSWANFMMMSSNGNLFRVTGPLCGEFAGHKASDAELWCFLWSAQEQTVE